MKPTRRIAAVLLLCAFPCLLGCSARTPARPVPAVSEAGSLALLRADLDRIFADPNFAAAQWGVEVLSLDRSEMLYERNSNHLYMPASNNKLLTTSAALVRLGPDFRYETRIMADGPVQDGTLRGNLVVVGSGDPGTAPRFSQGDPFRTFREWASRLKEEGIRRIDGNLLGDGAAFEENMLGDGWEWDDLAYGYAAPVSALQFNENLETVEITPGESEGSPATLSIKPLEKYLSIENGIVTGAVGTRPAIDAEAGAEKGHFVLKGTVPLRGESVTQSVAVQDPSHFYLEALKIVLEQEGVDVSRGTVKAVRGWNPPSLRLLWIHKSPPLAEIIKPLLKISQNLYAETLTRTLGSKFGAEGSFARGKEVVEGALHEMSVEKETYAYADGSGLSRHNLLTADILVRIFRYMYRHAYFRQFYDALPDAGVDGTLAERMKGTRAENNVRAKTGTIAYVRSLSGYVKTADGEMLTFSMIANNFLVSSKMAEYVQDSALERLANFSRSGR